MDRNPVETGYFAVLAADDLRLPRLPRRQGPEQAFIASLDADYEAVHGSDENLPADPGNSDRRS
jgi:hypothetical protein